MHAHVDWRVASDVVGRDHLPEAPDGERDRDVTCRISARAGIICETGEEVLRTRANDAKDCRLVESSVADERVRRAQTVLGRVAGVRDPLRTWAHART
jgi:hypothetical protein